MLSDTQIYINFFGNGLSVIVLYATIKKISWLLQPFKLWNCLRFGENMWAWDSGYCEIYSDPSIESRKHQRNNIFQQCSNILIVWFIYMKFGASKSIQFFCWLEWLNVWHNVSTGVLSEFFDEKEIGNEILFILFYNHQS